jgi:type IV pilus assembly protein PilW
MISLIKQSKNNCISLFAANADGPAANPYKSGLTLVELMIVMILSLVLVGSAFMAYLAQSKTSREQHEIASLQQNIRVIMDMIDRDVRNSGCTDPRFASVSAFQAADSGVNSLGLRMDMNLDGATTADGERVIYRLNETTLQRTNQGVTTTLLENVTNFGVVYFGINNTQIVPSGTLTQAQAGNVLSVEVTLGMQSENLDPDTGETVKRLVRRRMQSRNQEILLKGM